jgi:DNA-binding IclR family transcriptional regulator
MASPVVNAAMECPSCRKDLDAAPFWVGANYCRGLYLLEVIASNPGMSGWELSQLTGMPNHNVTSGLTKLREWWVVDARAEERDQGGIRYRYFSLTDAPRRKAFEEAARAAEAARDKQAPRLMFG